ncbi:MAG TPA: hypothetical protein VG326_11070 [Tepidisphaeraceae bacterium]|jgi:hypothetical protein|nr:hypothetical protein [Tepidisphaeraceae bacterium]
MRVGLLTFILIAPVAGAAPPSPSTRPAPASAPASAPADTPKQALRALNIALRDGDAAAIRELFITRDEDGARLIDAMADYSAALVLLHKAAEQAYGAEGANKVTGDMTAQSAEGLAAIDKGEVAIDGDSAIVKFTGANDPPVRLVKVNGSWKLPFWQLLEGADKGAEQRRFKELKHQADLARKTAAEVKVGRYREGALKAAEVWRSRLLELATPVPMTKPS